MRYSIYHFAVLAIALGAVAFVAVPKLRPAAAQSAATAPTISIDELQRSIDLNALPVQEIKEPV